MLQLALPVFFLMFGAAFLGFLIAWAWRKLAIDALRMELDVVRSNVFDIEQDRQQLASRANTLQLEKESLQDIKENLAREKSNLTQQLDELFSEKVALESALSQVQNQSTMSSPNMAPVDIDYQTDQLNQQLENQQLAIAAKEAEIAEWRQKFANLTANLPPTPDVDALRENFRKQYDHKKKKWKSKYKNLHFKLLKVARERDELLKKKGQLPGNKTTKKQDGNTTLTKLKKKFNKWKVNPKEVAGSAIELLKVEASDQYLNDVTDNQEIINLEKLGNLEDQQKDDLEKINGIDTFAKNKLNAMGIYRFQQIAQLEEEDILLINKILDLDSDYIQENTWMEQAERLK